MNRTVTERISMSGTGRRIAILALSVVLIVLPVQAQQPANGNGPEPAGPAALRERIAELLDDPKFASARWGVRIARVGTNGDDGVIFERDADKSFIPASNMKLYTSAAALDAFGPDFTITTSVYATRPATRLGTLRGDLILYGRGDPNLSPRFEGENPDRYSEHVPADRIAPIERLADQIRARGIRVITGDIIGDDSFFAGDLLGPGWEWDDAQFYYGAEVSALTVNDNVVTFIVTPGRRPGEKPAIRVQPDTSYIRIVNNATTVREGATRIGIHRPLDDNTIEFFGSIPLDAQPSETNISVHNPALFAATLLKEALDRRGIRHPGRIRRIDARRRLTAPFDASKLIELASIQSRPMSEMLKVINKQSQNLHTELMLLQLGARLGAPQPPTPYGQPRSTISLGNEVRRTFLESAGIPVRPLNLRDGSGLARQNLVTPRSTSMLLEFMLRHPHAGIFRDSLGIAGVDGTLERRMRDSAAANNLRGKTGTLSNVNALSGYLMTRAGDLLIISLMGNNYTGPGRDVTSVMDRICILLAEFEYPMSRK
ncbi:MAG: D-alanyl-D-alanine carboxypeptidase/D-alanyl-D-alanine-endopeptidase [Acidobacteriota bacterium]|nr:MAG: D-alanyl-D-alanine carboxypeptidase/D-alanyl-D-alanine-endopeptidase [Acidobacteriota bacterium]